MACSCIGRSWNVIGDWFEFAIAIAIDIDIAWGADGCHERPYAVRYRLAFMLEIVLIVEGGCICQGLFVDIII